MTIEQRAAEAAKAHRAKGTGILGSLVVVRFDGVEIPVGEAERLAEGAGLDKAKLPRVQDRGAIRKALHALGIQPSARHGGKGTSPAAQAAGEGACLRYSRVSATGGDVVYSIREERVEQAEGELPRIVDGGERQRLCYFASERRIQVYMGLLREEIQREFGHWRGAYKSDSIRAFLERALDDDAVKGVKFAGSTWFVPSSEAADDRIARLRKFCREVPGITWTAVVIVDEPGGKEDVMVSARQSVEADMADLQARLAEIERRRKDGVEVRDTTAERILDDGRALREKLRTLKTLLAVEGRSVEEKLSDLDTAVRKFLEV